MTKVYVVEVGAYSDKYIDSVFTTRELAERYIVERRRRQGTVYGRPFIEPDGLTFGEWQELVDNWWNATGDVYEYDLWDAVPIADLAPVEG